MTPSSLLTQLQFPSMFVLRSSKLKLRHFRTTEQGQKHGRLNDSDTRRLLKTAHSVPSVYRFNRLLIDSLIKANMTIISCTSREAMVYLFIYGLFTVDMTSCYTRGSGIFSFERNALYMTAVHPSGTSSLFFTTHTHTHSYLSSVCSMHLSWSLGLTYIVCSACTFICFKCVCVCMYIWRRCCWFIY